jgi:hypothetical protein
VKKWAYALIPIALFAGCVSKSSGEPETTLSSTPSTAARTCNSPASQCESEAMRDGVIPELALLPVSMRVDPLVEVSTDEGTWMLARPTEELINSTTEVGCQLGNLSGTYPDDVICVLEYGEVLLVDGQNRIIRAYPMPGATPSWIHVTDAFVYAGQIGDGALPDSTLIRIDRTTQIATIVLIPAPFDGGQEWPSDWIIASPDLTAAYEGLVNTGPDAEGTSVNSWIGMVSVDLDGIDNIFDALDT